MQTDCFVQDSVLAEAFKKAVSKCDQATRDLLKSVTHCGMRTYLARGEKSAVILLSNGKRATFSGLLDCDNAFICPKCQARIMTMYAQRIDTALDEMAKRGYKAVMCTFTFPHLRFISCREGVLMLAKMKSNFLKKTKNTTAQNFLDSLGIKDYVWSAEFTFSQKHGWHPHYHTIFWVKADKINEVLQWESKLRKLWLDSAKRYMLKLKPDEQKTVETLFKTANNSRGGVYFSKKADGTIREIQSGKYLAGWKASKEMTGLEIKRAASGHYTPRQLLEMGTYGDRFAMNRYIEYAVAVRTKNPSIRRVQFSHGLVGRIKNWQQAKSANEFLLKKKETNIYKPVVWFSVDDWKYICHECPLHTRSNILFLARFPDMLFKYLDILKIPYHLPSTNRLCSIAADAYNAAA